mmetsp:Transcript_723/g.2545  ORF Transcript_723/g.2545 Transcript_723/m.2545 type:complete len:179 (-) Transcript_723:164-700(-)
MVPSTGSPKVCEAARPSIAAAAGLAAGRPPDGAHAPSSVINGNRFSRPSRGRGARAARDRAACQAPARLLLVRYTSAANVQPFCARQPARPTRTVEHHRLVTLAAIYIRHCTYLATQLKLSNLCLVLYTRMQAAARCSLAALAQPRRRPFPAIQCLFEARKPITERCPCQATHTHTSC